MKKYDMRGRVPKLGPFTGVLLFMIGLFFRIIAGRMMNVCANNKLVSSCMPAQMFGGFGRLFMRA